MMVKTLITQQLQARIALPADSRLIRFLSAFIRVIRVQVLL